MNSERLKNLAELKKLVKIKRDSLDKISKFLVSKGMARSFAEEISLRTLKEPEGMRALANLLQMAFPLAQDISLSDAMFAGIPGSGDKRLGAFLEAFPFDEEKIEEIGKKAVENKSSLHLVLSAQMKEEDLYFAFRQFSMLPLCSVVFTHIDQTLTPGSLYNVMKRVSFPVSALVDSKNIYRENSSALARYLLTHTNEKEFQLIRSIVMSDRDGRE